MLTKKQFDILEQFTQGQRPSQRTLAAQLGISLGTVNRQVRELTVQGLLDAAGLTAAGLEALEPYRVRRAVIIAAGFGSRLVPITLNTPKPLVRVHGVRLIDTMLDALLTAGITDIWLIRGYLAEQFDQLLYKYPMLHFLENSHYNESNTISSVLAAGDRICGSYLVEADLLVKNPGIIRPYQYRSNYIGVYTDRTDDWCLLTDRNGYCRRMVQGGTDCYHMYGVSYWTAEDGARLAEHLKQVWDLPGGRERYFDQAVFDYFPEQYDVAIRPVDAEDILEIDSFRELRAIDPTYDVR